jgi:hypothetical protein
MQAIIFDWRRVDSVLGNDVLYRLMRADEAATKVAFDAGLYSNHLVNEAHDENGLYEILNIRHPIGYNNRSMSVGDLAVTRDGRILLCSMVGWRDVTSLIDPARSEVVSP